MTDVATWGRVAGDVKDTLTVGVNGFANLSNVTGVVGLVRKRGDTSWTQLVAEVLSAIACTVTVHLGDAGGWLPASAYARADGLDELYELKLRLTFVDGSKLTVPEKGGGRLEIEGPPSVG